jgi:antitoxin component of RelBE/YafQ-DinJ toxin-antitoxin module
MTTITINERTAKGKSLIEFLKKFHGEGFISFKDEPEKTPNKVTLKAMRDAETGKVTKSKNVKDLIAKLNS